MSDVPVAGAVKRSASPARMDRRVLWAVSKPNSGIVVTTLENANHSRLSGVFDTKRQAVRAAIRLAKSDITHAKKEIRRRKADQKTFTAVLAKLAT